MVVVNLFIACFHGLATLPVPSMYSDVLLVILHFNKVFTHVSSAGCAAQVVC